MDSLEVQRRRRNEPSVPLDSVSTFAICTSATISGSSSASSGHSISFLFLIIPLLHTTELRLIKPYFEPWEATQQCERCVSSRT